MLLVSSLLGAEVGQDAVLRTLLYERVMQTVAPYSITVAEFTARISELRNWLTMCGIKDKGIIIPLYLGAENCPMSNIHVRGWLLHIIHWNASRDPEDR